MSVYTDLSCYFLVNPQVWYTLLCKLGLPQWLSSKESICNAGETGSIPRSGRSPGERNGNPVQYFCLQNSIDRGGWLTTVYEVPKESDIT